jgi:hypothetical protein
MPNPTLVNDLLDRLTQAEHERDALDNRMRQLLITPAGDRPDTDTITVAELRDAINDDSPRSAGLGSPSRAQDLRSAEVTIRLDLADGRAMLALMREAHAGVDHLPDEQVDCCWTSPHRRALRAAYRLGYAAGLGYEITVNEDGDRVVVGDRREQPAPPADVAGPTAEQVDEALTATATLLARADSDTERAEAVEVLLEWWYDSWLDTAVTSPHEGLARELVRLLHPPAAPPGDEAAQREQAVIAAARTWRDAARIWGPTDHWADPEDLALIAAVDQLATARRTAQPAPGPQDIPADQVDALLAEDHHDQLRAEHIARAAYRVGYAAALGYRITVEDDHVHIGDHRALPVAPKGCDDCSVEPGETHRYPACPGAIRLPAVGGPVTARALLPDEGAPADYLPRREAR